MSGRRRLTLDARLSVLLVGVSMLAATVALAAAAWLGHTPAAALCAALVMLPAVVLAARWWTKPLLATFRALAGTASRFSDDDFSFTLYDPGEDELGELVRAHNVLAESLRAERHSLVERELLLDTVMQNSPVAVVLTDAADTVVYGNQASRHLFHQGRPFQGTTFATLVGGGPTGLAEAVADGGDRLFSFEVDGSEETYHLSQRHFRLNGRAHTLHLFKRLTRELARQEVATWKKVIRVISHELNNSLGPISSMAHSGKTLVERGEHTRLERVFSAIEERAQHLDAFIRGYARFAKLPTPNPEPVQWLEFVERLRSQLEFTVIGTLPEQPGNFDPAQIEQVLINLVKNAVEAGSPLADITLEVRSLGNAGTRIELADRGSGMSDTVLQHALLPFYSTKRSGTGLGLALAREILEAHGGRLTLANRAGGGLSVTMVLPVG